MKRLVVLVIAAVIIGKLFASELLRLTDNSSTASKNLGQNLRLDKDLNSQLKLNHLRSNMDIVRHFPPRPLTTKKPLPHRAPLTPLVSKVAKTDEKNKEEAKKDQDRRKERQKKLEEKANQTAQTKPTVPAAFVLPPPVTVPDYSSYYGAIPVSGGTANVLANTNPVSEVTTQTPVTASRVSTLGTNSAAVTGWIKLLTTDPSAAAMTSFESQYSKNEITQAQYYQVLTAMQSSSNVESQNYAVQGANLYQNISSFKILADESVNGSNPTVAAAANADLTTYQNTADASILNAALASGDPAEVAAAQKLRPVVAGTNPTPPTPGTPTPPAFHL